MARRKAQAVELAVQNEAFYRWRILLRHPLFQKSVNRLRSQYLTWVVNGLPITQYTYEFASTDLDEFGTEIPRQIEKKGYVPQPSKVQGGYQPTTGSGGKPPQGGSSVKPPPNKK